MEKKNVETYNVGKKYSVLMSVYKNDSPEFLDLALKSIYDQQTKKPDEIVIVLDGPVPDCISDVLYKFQKNKEEIVKIYPQQINRGLGDALRIGTEFCTGDFIFRMDSDDISATKRFEIMEAYMEKHPEVDVLGTDIAEFNESPYNEEMRIRSCPTEHQDIVKMGKRRNPMNHVSVCIKKAALEKCGGYEKLLLLEDYYLWLKMIVADCRLANIHESLVYVRVGNGFDTKRGDKERIKGWKVLQEYMYKHDLIKRIDVWINMIYIWCFVNMPVGMKKYVYTKLLRK